MPNPGAFQGSRKEFLVSKKVEFVDSVVSGYTGESLAKIQREYFKRYPIDLPHNEEPTAEHLAAVDDDAPDPEVEEPDEKTMDPEEYKLAMSRIAERKLLVTKRRAQIKCWFIYQYMKDHDSDPRDQRARSPYQAYLAKIRGADREKPRRKSAVNIWRKFQRDRIDTLSKVTAEKENVPKSRMAALRDRIARELFDELPPEEQQEWSNISVEEHNNALKEWEAAKKGAVSTDPGDRQQAIQGLVRFVQPVLDVIADSTGWKVSLFAGGPEPAQEGMLNVISVHSGTTTGDIKLSFGQSERGSIKKDFIPTFGAFLQKCYSPEECRARALSDLEGFVPISDMEMEGGDAMVHDLSEFLGKKTGPTDTSPAPPAVGNEVTVGDQPILPAAVPPSLVVQPSVGPLPAPTPSPSIMPPSAEPSSMQALPAPSPALSITPPVVPTIQALPASSDVQPNIVPSAQPSTTGINSASPLESTGSEPVKFGGAEESGDEDDETPFPLTYRMPSEEPPALSALFPSPSRQPTPAPSAAPSPAVSRRPSLAPSLPPSPLLAPCSLTPAANPISSSGGVNSTLLDTASALTVAQSNAVPAANPATPSTETVDLATVGCQGLKKAQASRAVGRENVLPSGCQSAGEDGRPRREVKKTAKAISFEEEKNACGKKRSHEPSTDGSTSGRVSKKLRRSGTRGGAKA